ncbi:MAG: RsmB/NOP family class I SAM-dependent RNA methyltransferase [Alphaproteobacteria bacterium]|nr:MAG: RsmB/NOP family class I SAM-dependent RNA methyltransferase [Alphaproteobacteria bacterium]
MTPAARVQAVIEIIDAIEQSLVRQGAPADDLIRSYFARRRYAGSRDRAAITDLVYRILRHRARIRACLEQTGTAVSARLMVLGDLVVLGGAADDEIANLFRGDRFAPAPLTREEWALVAGLRQVMPDSLPRSARLEVPEWLEPFLEARFQDAFESELSALGERAPVTIRANRLKTTRDALRDHLEAENVLASHCRYAPEGLIVKDSKGLSQTKAFRDGLFEVQDEAAQLAALIVDAAPGQQVLDLCAGAGGKTLAVAAAMANSGQLYAADVNRGRLEELKRRAKRAGAHDVQPLLLDEAGDRRKAKLGDLTGRFDRVILDVPCSGSGTWRRNPDLRWRYGPHDLERFLELQRRLLDEAAELVKPGGRIVYITCSLLPPENEDQIRAFLDRHCDFAVMPYELLLPDRVQGLPAGDCGLDGALCLTPATHGTDGFFVAVMARERTSEFA